MAILAAVVAVLALAMWEARVRSDGYATSYNDAPYLWAPLRAAARGASPDQLVVVGSSRIMFDIDQTTFDRLTGQKPVLQLATVGSNPLIVLEELAADPSFRATVIAGVVPVLYTIDVGLPVTIPTSYVRYSRTQPLSERLTFPIYLWLQDHLAMINQDDLTVSALFEDHVRVPDRPAAHVRELPPYGYTIDARRQARLTDRVLEDPAFQSRLRRIWMGLFAPPVRPSIIPSEQWSKMLSDGWHASLSRLRRAVLAIESRGGTVIFVRPPSSGELRQLEAQTTPREAVWDRILLHTGAEGLHFEDHAGLRGFDCPDSSHLSPTDAAAFTESLVELLHERGLVRMVRGGVSERPIAPASSSHL